MTAKKKEEQKITLRLPDGLHEALREQSEILSLSINDLVVVVLWKFFERL